MANKDTGVKPARKKPKKRLPSQRERFIAAAKESGADESGEKFERAIQKIARAKAVE